MNIVIASGRLTKKPELRSTATGTNVCSFSIAVNENNKTEFLECVCFNKIAENLVKYKDKGDLIELKGRLETNTYTDKEGKKHYKTYISIETINYINQSQTNGYEAKNEQKDAYQEMRNRIDSETDLPF